MNDKKFDIQYYQTNTLTGIYSKCILSQKGEGEHLGHYMLVVNDNLSITLLPPYLPESKRPQAEVARLEGKKVQVTGMITPQTNLSAPTRETQPLSLSMPCFISIDSIALAA